MVKFYRVLKVELAQPASFEISDKKLIEFLRDKSKMLVVFDDIGVDVQHIPVDLLQEALDSGVGMTLDVKEFLKRDIDFAKERRNSHVQYIVVGG